MLANIENLVNLVNFAKGVRFFFLQNLKHTNTELVSSYPNCSFHSVVFCGSKNYYYYYLMKSVSRKMYCAIQKLIFIWCIYLQHSNCVWSSRSLTPSRNANNSLSRLDKSMFFTEIHSVFDSHVNILTPVVISAFCKKWRICKFTRKKNVI